MCAWCFCDEISQEAIYQEVNTFTFRAHLGISCDLNLNIELVQCSKSGNTDMFKILWYQRRLAWDYKCVWMITNEASTAKNKQTKKIINIRRSYDRIYDLALMILNMTQNWHWKYEHIYKISNVTKLIAWHIWVTKGNAKNETANIW